MISQHDQDRWTINAMIEHGGGFVKALGNAALRADDRNLAIIKKAFPDYWTYYQDIGEHMRKDDEAKEANEC